MRYESDVRVFASQAMAGRPLFDMPVRVVINIFLPIAQSWSMKRRSMARLGEIRPTVKPDMDNVIKAIFDALNGVVWNDDVQVVLAQVGKYYSEQPEVRVFVEAVDAQGSRGSGA